MQYVSWTRMEDGTRADWDLLVDLEDRFNADLVDRVLAMLKSLDVDWGGYRVNRYVHSLQCATRALRDGADDDMVVAALLHDIGDIIAPYNHGELAAAVLKPYVSEKVLWIVRHHTTFQGYYYNHFLGGDRNARDRYRDHPWYEDCVKFCAEYDQNSFDPDYDTLPLEAFEPIVRRVMTHESAAHLELKDPAPKDAAPKDAAL